MLLVLSGLTALSIYFSSFIGADLLKASLCVLNLLTGAYLFFKFYLAKSEVRLLKAKLVRLEQALNSKTSKMANNLLRVLELYESNTAPSYIEPVKNTNNSRSMQQNEQADNVSSKPKHAHLMHKQEISIPGLGSLKNEITPDLNKRNIDKSESIYYSVENGLVDYRINKIIRYTENEIIGYRMSAVYNHDIFLSNDDICDPELGSQIYCDILIKAIRFLQAKSRTDKFLVFLDIPYWALVDVNSVLYKNIEFEQFDIDLLVLNVINSHMQEKPNIDHYIKRAISAGIKVSLDASNIKTLDYIINHKLTPDFVLLKSNIAMLNNKPVHSAISYLNKNKVELVSTSVKTEHERSMVSQLGIENVEGPITGRPLRLKV